MILKHWRMNCICLDNIPLSFASFVFRRMVFFVGWCSNGKLSLLTVAFQKDFGLYACSQRPESPTTILSLTIEYVLSLNFNLLSSSSIRPETKPCEPVDSDPPNQSSNESIEVPGIDDDNLTLGAEGKICFKNLIVLKEFERTNANIRLWKYRGSKGRI